MHLVPTTVTALVLSLSPFLAEAEADTPATAKAPPSLVASATPKGEALAETLVEAGGEREIATEELKQIEARLSAQILRRLSLSDPAVAAKLKQVVDEAVSPIAAKSVDAMVDAYAANFSDKELGDAITFVNSPTGQVEKANAPLLKAALTAVVVGGPASNSAEDAAARAFAAASQQARVLVQRILAAQDFEVRTRRGYYALLAVEQAAVAPLRSLEAEQTPVSDAERRAELAKTARDANEYVRATTTVQKGFYVTHYTDAQLSAAADYLESEAGHAMLVRMPLVRRAVVDVWSQQLPRSVSSLLEPVCAAVSCSADQRVRMSGWATSTAAAMSTIVPAMAGLLE